MPATWICEKYNIAKTLSTSALGGISSHTPPIIKAGNGDTVIYTSGSIVQNANPETYDPSYKSWDKADVGALVANGFKTEPTTDRSGKPRIQDVKAINSVLQASTHVVIATDPGREGEVIAWRLLEHCNYQGPIQRLWTSSQKPDAIKIATTNLLQPLIKKPLFHAGLARTAMDWIEGLAATRLMTRRHQASKGVLSAGRVQTSLVALIDDRCKEIEDFIPKQYWVLLATVTTATGKLKMTHSRPENHPFIDENEAKQAAADAVGMQAPLKLATNRRNKEPPNFATTPDVQQAAFRRHKMTPTTTLDTMQELYEAGLITYPRTECPFVEESFLLEMPEKLKQSRLLPGIAAVESRHPEWFQNPVIRRDRYDDTKIKDHGAIVPDEKIVNPTSLSSNQALVYEIIVRRTVASLLPDHTWDATRITAIVNGNEYVATGKTVIDEGWKAVDNYEADDIQTSRRKSKQTVTQDEDQSLPLISNGDLGTFDPVIQEGRSTKPPPYYDQGTVIDAMVNLDLHLADPRAKSIMITPDGQKKGLGTGATRHTAIAIVQNRGYVDASSGKMVITPRGRDFITIVRRDLSWLADPLHTVRQEIALYEIEEKSRDHLQYIEETRTHMSGVVSRIIRTTAVGKVSETINAVPFGQKSKIPAAAPRSTPKRKPATPGITRGLPKGISKSKRTPAPKPIQTHHQPYSRPTATPPTTVQTGAMRFFAVPTANLMQARRIGLRLEPNGTRYYAPTEDAAKQASELFKEVL